MIFDWMHSRPKFRIGVLVRIPPGPNPNSPFRYLLIEGRRWSKVEKQWLYNGIDFIITRGELIYASDSSRIRERSIQGIPGLDYPQQGFILRWA
jgi:hypothetical protein